MAAAHGVRAFVLSPVMPGSDVLIKLDMHCRWQCSQKLVADSHDNHIAPVLDRKSSGVHQHQLHILQWSANGINGELPLLGDLLEATNVVLVCI